MGPNSKFGRPDQAFMNAIINWYVIREGVVFDGGRGSYDGRVPRGMGVVSAGGRGEEAYLSETKNI